MLPSTALRISIFSTIPLSLSLSLLFLSRSFPFDNNVSRIFCPLFLHSSIVLAVGFQMLSLRKIMYIVFTHKNYMRVAHPFLFLLVLDGGDYLCRW